MSSESVRVRFFNLDFALRSGTDAETTKEVARYVNEKIAELQGLTSSGDNVKIAVLCALNIAGELFQTKAKYEAEVKKTQEYEEKVKSMISKIDTVIKKD